MFFFFFSGRIRIGAGGAVLEHPGIRGPAPDRDRSVLLRSEHVQESDGRGGPIGDQLREHTRDLHRETGAPGVQRCDAVHGRDSDEHTAEAAAREISYVRPLLLADLRAAVVADGTFRRLFDGRKAVE